MVSGLGDQELAFLDGVDKPVLVGYASGPKAGQIVLQRLGFAQAFKGVTNTTAPIVGSSRRPSPGTTVPGCGPILCSFVLQVY